ncbi:hypothetical protein B0H16DRAFT_1452625 [Mycena metata]|uniref:DUF6535 domain-containing protein n=1 Tax=Mycena metata TaxID=1033252 RepID=A0AAD7JSN9_9AGAR|nr:hypothetical protein B0H16DRAFT_1452625 [Mycena metata]
MPTADDPPAISQSDNDRCGLTPTGTDRGATDDEELCRLIAALQTCFVDLAKKQEEQGEKLYRAMEALKLPVPTTDKKTSFWNSYMKLADEYDKEFHAKYSTDLDTALIFIEPQLATDPPKIIIIVQCLLYASLSTTLLAVLLAVLGKQWLMYYQAAGSRGTIEKRGLERQRKLDGWGATVTVTDPPVALPLFWRVTVTMEGVA